MSKAHSNADDVRMRLNRTIGFYKNHPYYIRADTSIPEWYNVLLYKLGKGTSEAGIVVDHRSDDLVMCHPPLGYINYEKSATYLVRRPERRQAEGLRSDMVMGLNPIHGNYFASSAMEALLLNNYPSFSTVLTDIIDNGWKSRAISKDLALGWMDPMKIALYFKNRVVATYNPNKDSFTILQSKESSFIRKFLLKDGGLLDGKTVN